MESGIEFSRRTFLKSAGAVGFSLLGIALLSGDKQTPIVTAQGPNKERGDIFVDPKELLIFADDGGENYGKMVTRVQPEGSHYAYTDPGLMLNFSEPKYAKETIESARQMLAYGINNPEFDGLLLAQLLRADNNWINNLVTKAWIPQGKPFEVPYNLFKGMLLQSSPQAFLKLSTIERGPKIQLPQLKDASLHILPETDETRDWKIATCLARGEWFMPNGGYQGDMHRVDQNLYKGWVEVGQITRGLDNTTEEINSPPGATIGIWKHEQGKPKRLVEVAIWS